MPYLLKLKIILQSKIFIGISLFFTILYVLIFTKFIAYDSKLDINEKILTGTIISFNIDGNKLSMIVKNNEKVQVSYYINSFEEKEYLEKNMLIGSKITIEGNLSKPYNNTIPNTFNYKKYLYNNKIYMIFNANKIKLSPNTSFLNKIKTKFIQKIANYNTSSAYLYALILGSTNYIPSDIYQEYQENGTTHLFAVSGMHITMLVLFLSTIFKKIKLSAILSNIIIIFVLFFYMFLIGFTPSILRGSLLFVLLFINRQLKIGLKTINLLYLLFVILIFINPFFIYNLSFIYSFTTSFGLILFSERFKGNYFIKLAKISLIAFLFSFPITLYNFYEINLLTVINNIIIVPFVTFILFPLALIAFILPIFEPLLNISVNILETINHLLNFLQVRLIVPNVNLLFILLSYIFIYLIYKFNFKYVVLLIILIIFYKLSPYIDSNSYVYFLDVGQGDSTVIVGNNLSYTVMIDTGGKIKYTTEDWQIRNNEFDLSTNIITFLKSIGLSKLDLLIITHGDIDHLGYALQIKKKIKIKNIWFNKNSYNKLEKDLLKGLSEANYNKLKIKNLNSNISEDENKSSLVLHFRIDKINFLIMGDAPKEVEREIMYKYSFKNDVIKLGHHGSKTSSDEEFLLKYYPRYAIISSGRNNNYNHPAKETIETLDALKIAHFNTQDKGTIVFKIKNIIKKIKFYPP